MIGGEFEIGRIPSGGAVLPGAYASGRAALYQILRSLGAPATLWLPSWICSSVVEAAVKAGWKVAHYSLTETMEACLESVEARKGDAILVVNYFGMVDCGPQIRALREALPGITLIEDDVQAYYAFASGSEAPYSFTSLRKCFAVPDGGLARSSAPLPEAGCENTFAALKVEGAQLKAGRTPQTDDKVYLALLEEGERRIDLEYDAAMSASGAALWQAVDKEEVARRRLANASLLQEGLRAMGVKPILEPTQGQVPLFLPILSEKRDQLRRHLFAHEVYSPVHWPGTDLGGRELSLICDQRYGAEDMELILTLTDDIL